MASILVTLSKGGERTRASLLWKIKNLTGKVVGAKPEKEGDRIRCGAALLIGPIRKVDGGILILISWPDGLYPSLVPEMRAFVSSLSMQGVTIS